MVSELIVVKSRNVDSFWSDCMAVQSRVITVRIEHQFKRVLYSWRQGNSGLTILGLFLIHHQHIGCDPSLELSQ